MKSPLYLLLAAALTLPVAALAAGPSAHDHGTGEPQKVELNAGKKWQIDAPLRQGMGAMRKAVNHMLPLAHAGKAQAADYDALGAEVSRQVAYIVENCKLDPKADAQLHIVIGEILGGQGHAAGGLHAQVAGLVVGGERLQAGGMRAGAGRCQQYRQGRGESDTSTHRFYTPRYSTSRRSISSSPSLRCRMRIGVGTPLATQSTVWSPSLDVRATRSAS